ncbi:hypothetical protein FA95DRAFT_1488644, partial [Auriscalpium vulgare]
MRSADSSLNSFSLPPPWTSQQQHRFEALVGRLTAAIPVSFSWVENPAWHAFCAEFIPGAHMFSPRERAKGNEATGQCDGWSGENHHHYLAFMMVAGRECHTVQLVDASAERKTAENLLGHMKSSIYIMETEFGVFVVAFCSDASGESRKARVILGKERPDLVLPDCYAHQVNLVVGDYFKTKATFLLYTEQATDLITWLRSKTFVLALLRDIQKGGGRVRTVIRAVLTRWTSHYLAYDRLLELQPALRALVSTDELRGSSNSQVITGDASAKRRATRMVGIIKDSAFWDALACMKLHLEPLAIAANIAQAANTRPDTVLLMFGVLRLRYDSLPQSDPRHIVARDAVCASLEKRWAVADQDIFITAVILNPFHKLRPFRAARWSTTAGAYTLITRLWTRFYKHEVVPQSLFGELMNY